MTGDGALPRESKPYVQRAAIWLAVAGAALMVGGLAADPTVERFVIAVVAACLVVIAVELLVAAFRSRRRTRP